MLVVNRSENYWKMKQHAYPFQIEVPHMSDMDLDPRLLPKLIGWEHHFLRVPFFGVAHWGFQTQLALNLFKQVAFSPKREARREARR